MCPPLLFIPNYLGNELSSLMRFVRLNGVKSVKNIFASWAFGHSPNVSSGRVIFPSAVNNHV